MNLDFQEPNVPPIPGSFGGAFGRATDVFYGWDIYRNDEPYDFAPYNYLTYYGNFYFIPAMLATSFDYFVFPVNPGNGYFFTPLILAGAGLKEYNTEGQWNEWGKLELRQTGVVPSDALKISYFTRPIDSAYYGPLVWLEYEGVRLSDPKVEDVDPRLARSGVEHFSYDVSAYRGKEVTLRILSAGAYGGYFKIVGFSSVPEPGTAALVIFGGAGLWWLAGSGRRKPRPKLGGAPARETGR